MDEEEQERLYRYWLDTPEEYERERECEREEDHRYDDDDPEIDDWYRQGSKEEQRFLEEQDELFQRECERYRRGHE